MQYVSAAGGATGGQRYVGEGWSDLSSSWAVFNISSTFMDRVKWIILTNGCNMVHYPLVCNIKVHLATHPENMGCRVFPHRDKVG
jgi:hypothetical protein